VEVPGKEMAKPEGNKPSRRPKQPVKTPFGEPFDQAVEAHPRARRSFEEMMSHGRSGQKTLALLHAYVEHEHMLKGFAAVQRQTGFSRKRIDTMASGYERAGREIGYFLEYGRLKSDNPEEQIQLDDIFPPALYHLAAQSPVKHLTTTAGQTISIEEGFALLPELLKNFSVVLRSSWPREITRSGTLDRRYGMKMCLFCAASLMRKATGQPCYPDLAALIEAFHMAMGKAEAVEPGKLEKAVAGFRKGRYREAAAQLEKAPWMHE
jgi:hypothetical protein